MSVITNKSITTTDEVASQEFSRFRERSNPMLNTLVLQTLFENVSIGEIKTYRQVCKLWWEESLPRWRRNAQVKLCDSGDNGEQTLSIRSYLDGMNDSSDPFQFGKYPYKNFQLKNWNRISLVDEYDRQLEFFSKCGAKMTKLEILFSTFRSIDDFEAILFRFVPKLVELSLYGNTLLGEDDKAIDLMDAPCESRNNNLEKVLLGRSSGRFQTISWLRFLGQFPKMNSLKILNFRALPERPYTPGGELTDILNAMINLGREQGISWKLEELDLLLMGEPWAAVFENDHSELFRLLQLPLTTLCLHVCGFTTRTALQCILESCAFTLRKLVVYRARLTSEDVEEDYGQDFPYGVQLDTLSELWMVGRHLCDNLNFLQFTPNLTSLILAQDIGTSLLSAAPRLSCFATLGYISQKLSVEMYELHRVGHLREADLSIVEGTDFSRLELEHVVCPNLKEFILSGRQEKTCCADEFAALTRLMPNLKTLMLGLGNDGFLVACEGWKQLEVLIVQPYEVDQLGLTGNVPLLQHRLPNLTDLKSLRYFGMGFETIGRAEMSLTDESVLNAILPLKNLRGITAVYNVDTMGAKVRDQLMSKFPNSDIYGNEKKVKEWKFFDDYSDDINEGEGHISTSEDPDQWEEGADEG